MQNKIWSPLKPGDVVDIIAPAGRLSKEKVIKIADLLASWRLKTNIADDMFGDDLLCANSDSARLQHLQQALYNPTSKAIICARGGYGTTRLLPEIFKWSQPAQHKLLIGMSDISALQIFLQQQWQWATLHGNASVWHLAKSSLECLRQIILGEVKEVNFTDITPLNAAAMQTKCIEGSVVGGNLCLIQASLGTVWQLDTHDKIILLEETGERAYKIDRMLVHLAQAKLFSHAKAIILGDFLKGEEPDGTSLVMPILQRFAEQLAIPVLQINGVGHGEINNPIPLGTPAKLQLGIKSSLTCRLN